MRTASELLVRPMTAADVGAVHRIECACFSVPWSEASFSDSLGDAARHFFVAERDGELVGFCGDWRVTDEADLLNIAVRPDARRAGVASALLTALLRDAKADGIRVMHLEVRASNAGAVALYTKFRFRADGRRPRYYTRPTEDALLMSSIL